MMSFGNGGTKIRVRPVSPSMSRDFENLWRIKLRHRPSVTNTTPTTLEDSTTSSEDLDPNLTPHRTSLLPQKLISITTSPTNIPGKICDCTMGAIIRRRGKVCISLETDRSQRKTGSSPSQMR